MRQNDMNQGQNPAPPRAEDRQAMEGGPEGERWVAGGSSSWQEIKSRFVDDPAGALRAAEELVHRAVENKMRRLQDELAELRADAQPGRDGRSPSETEDMRTRLLRYEAYFERLNEARDH